MSVMSPGRGKRKRPVGKGGEDSEGENLAGALRGKIKVSRGGTVGKKVLGNRRPLGGVRSNLGEEGILAQVSRPVNAGG